MNKYHKAPVRTEPLTKLQSYKAPPEGGTGNTAHKTNRDAIECDPRRARPVAVEEQQVLDIEVRCDILKGRLLGWCLWSAISVAPGF